MCTFLFTAKVLCFFKLFFKLRNKEIVNFEKKLVGTQYSKNVFKISLELTITITILFLKGNFRCAAYPLIIKRYNYCIFRQRKNINKCGG